MYLEHHFPIHIFCDVYILFFLKSFGCFNQDMVCIGLGSELICYELVASFDLLLYIPMFHQAIAFHENLVLPDMKKSTKQQDPVIKQVFSVF